MKIGVMLDSFQVGTQEGLQKAIEVGASGVQIFATNNELAPHNLSAQGRVEIRRDIEASGLELTALCGDLGGHGFAVAEENTWKIEQTMAIIDLAVELGTNIITTHIGAIPSDKNTQRWKTMYDACARLADYASSLGAKFAIETGPEPSSLLREFLDSISSDGIAVNYDPANLVMLIGEDPVAGVCILADYIVHTHAKDGLYRKAGEYFITETPLGKGNVDFPRYLRALKDIGYHGYLTIEREVGDDPSRDIRDAVIYLEDLLIRINTNNGGVVGQQK